MRVIIRFSDLGHVRSVNRVIMDTLGRKRIIKGRILRPNLIGRGYFAVTLCKDGNPRSIAIHKLVAITWIGSCPVGQQIRHGNSGQYDNSISNLCYGTPSEDGLDKRRDGTHRGKPVRRSDGVKFITMTVAAEKSGCWRENIYNACNGIYKTAGGFSWEYIL